MKDETLFIRIMQITIFIFSLIFATFRFFDNHFPLLIFLNSIGLIFAVLTLLYTLKKTIDNDPEVNFLKQQRQQIFAFINLFMLLASLIGIIIVCLCVYSKIPSNLADSFAILALGLSLSNDSLANIIYGILIKLKNLKLRT